MNRIKSLILRFNPIDLIVVAFYIFLTILNFIYYKEIPHSTRIVLANFFLFFLVFLFSSKDLYPEKVNIWTHLHRWYIVPLIFLSFKELYWMVKPIRQIDYDKVLINIDRFLFGGDPTKFLHSIATPGLTELLQLAYATFFFLPVILGIELLIRKKEEEFYYATFLVLFGFFLSYIGYLLVPAIGPRFTLHDFANINKDLPGLYFTKYLRDYVNAGESIPKGTLNPALYVQRDVFPSGHTQMTLIVMYLAVRFKSKLKYFFLIVGTLLIFSTVYLWYHYVIDVIGGIIFMLFTIWSGYKLYNWWENFRGKKTFSFNK